jgi:hypothetical protein
MPKRHTQNLCEELNQIMAHLGKTSTKGLKKGFSPHSPDGAVICCDLVTIQFRGSVVTSDAGLLAYRELDDALGLSAMAADILADARTGKNGRHALVGLLRQSVFGRLAGIVTFGPCRARPLALILHDEQNQLRRLPLPS